MTSMTDTSQPPLSVAVGVDTHGEVHVAAAIDLVGRQLADRSFPATPAGYQALWRWAQTHGPVQVVGIEGTGAYGAGLCAWLQAHDVSVVEVDRPDRRTRRFQGKSDPIDAYAAARAALAGGHRVSVPKTRDGDVEAVRMLRIAHRSATKAKSVAWNQLHSVVLTAPAGLREQLRGLSGAALRDTCAGLRPARGPAPVPSPYAKRPPRPGMLTDPAAAAKATLRRLARRIATLEAELADIDDDLAPLLTRCAPTLLSLHGVGPDVAAQLLTTAGDNPDRLTSDAAFAHLCGVAPLDASSGRRQRHRLNRGGDRQANRALHTIALSRKRWDPRTHAYMQRRRAEGKTDREITRCLKRYIAREVQRAILTDLGPPPR